MNDISINDARVNLGRQFEVNVQSILKTASTSSTNTTTEGVSENVDEYFENVTKTISSTTLNNSRIITKRTSPAGGLYTLVGMDKATFDMNFSKVIQKAEAKDAELWSKFNDKKTADEELVFVLCFTVVHLILRDTYVYAFTADRPPPPIRTRPRSHPARATHATPIVYAYPADHPPLLTARNEAGNEAGACAPPGSELSLFCIKLHRHRWFVKLRCSSCTNVWRGRDSVCPCLARRRFKCREHRPTHRCGF